MGAELIISAVVGIVMAIASSASSSASADNERRYNEQLIKDNQQYNTNERIESQDYNTYMWNLTNNYNSIDEQLERGRKAGVSPSAIIGGSYNSASASPVTSSPASQSLPQSDALTSIMSSMLGTLPSMLNFPANNFKTIIEGVNTREMMGVNKQLINASIEEKFASTKQMLSQAGLNDVKVEEVKENLKWISKLNQVDLDRTLAETTKYYNECKSILQQIEESKQNIEESDARIERMTYQNAESAANADYILNSTDKVIAETQGQKVDNLIKGEVLTQEELKVAESRMRYNLALQLGIPLGSSEFEFNYALWKSGQLESYCDSVIVPTTQSTWKPSDFALPDRMATMLRFNGRLGLMGKDGPRGYDFWHHQFNTLANFLNPF